MFFFFVGGKGGGDAVFPRTHSDPTWGGVVFGIYCSLPHRLPFCLELPPPSYFFFSFIWTCIHLTCFPLFGIIYSMEKMLIGTQHVQITTIPSVMGSFSNIVNSSAHLEGSNLLMPWDDPDLILRWDLHAVGCFIFLCYHLKLNPSPLPQYFCDDTCCAPTFVFWSLTSQKLKLVVFQLSEMNFHEEMLVPSFFSFFFFGFFFGPFSLIFCCSENTLWLRCSDNDDYYSELLPSVTHTHTKSCIISPWIDVLHILKQAATSKLSLYLKYLLSCTVAKQYYG